jgi:DNA-binding LacI/PurR family transcriptional regulator
VLTGRKLVLPETRMRIEAAIAKLDYSVNAGARALATSRTMTLGLVVCFHEAEFSPAQATYLIAIADAAREHGYGMLLLTETDGESAIRRAVAGRQVDGLILLSVVEDDPRIAPIVEFRFPAVLVGMPANTRGVDAVDLDFAAAAWLLVDHLADHGHLEATLATWPDEIYTSGRTYASRFRNAAVDRAGARGMRLDVVSCPSGAEQVRGALWTAVSRPGAPRALLVHNDAAVAMLPMVLRDLHLAVPGDISVASLHSAELGHHYALPYTSVDAQPEAVAEQAVEVLIRRLAAPDAPVEAILVPPRLALRSSVRTVTPQS